MMGTYNTNKSRELLYHFDGNSNDSSGNGLNGSDTSMTYPTSAGVFNQGANWNGAGGYILRDPNSELNFNSDHTISFWFKSPAEIGNWNWIFAYGTYGYTIATNSWGLRVAYGGWFVDAVNNQPYVLSANTWYNVVFGRSSNATFCFVNGVKYGDGISTSYSGYPMTGTNMHFGLGPANEASNIKLDEFIFDNRAWSAHEARLYYSSGRGRLAVL